MFSNPECSCPSVELVAEVCKWSCMIPRVVCHNVEMNVNAKRYKERHDED